MGETLKVVGLKGSGSISIDLPGRKLATSKKPRMLTPSEIALLRQDLASALKVLGQDEIDDAHALIRENGFRPADFEIRQKANPIPSYPSPITGQVTVLRRSSGTVRIYAAGHATSWLKPLETDLKSGSFGRP